MLIPTRTLAGELDDARAEIERLRAENARLARERDLLLKWDVRRSAEGWRIVGLFTPREPFATREEAAAALIEYLERYYGEDHDR